MNLQPCTSCRRHVEVGVSACPFCGGAEHVSRSGLRATVGRMSRAAVFASAAACATSTPPARHAPPPPPPPDPVVVQKFSTAPPPAVGKGSVRGFVTRDGFPLAGVVVYAQSDAGLSAQATTGTKGEFELVDLDPGRWRLHLSAEVYDPYAGSRRPQEGPPMQPDIVVDLVAGQNERRDLATASPPVYEPDRGPCCKPYGAPPARRRVV